ncbi:MAG: hypothetical protein A2252_02990 [Elusimicrobia bacterium RIFOXYA2_FULL_39_19]|nr:MAG: hypothetical protein A2252_02990 [Elusimicrobia bacterium RIFOXYA2_FULL_39_19]
MNNKKTTLLLFSILIIGFFIRFWGIWFDLPHLYTTEEYKTVNYALKMGAGDLNPHFFNYPSFYLYFTLIISGIYFVIGKIFGIFANAHDFAYSFIQNPTNIYLILRFFSVLWSTAILYFIYAVGKKAFNAKTGLMAALMFCFIPSIIQSSHLIQPALPSMLFVLISFYYLIDYYQKGKNTAFYLSAGFLGIAFSTFYNALPLFLLLPVVYWLKNKSRPLSIALFSGLLLVAVFFLIGTPYALLDYKAFIKDFSGHSVGVHLNPWHSIKSITGHYLYIANKGHVNPNAGIPLIGAICFLGVLSILKNKKTEELLVLSAIILFTLPVIFYHAAGPGYLFPAFPFFILAGAGFVDKISNNRYKNLVTALLITALIPSVIFCVKLDYAYTQKDTRTISKEWVENNISFGSKVLVDMYPHCPPLKETKAQLARLYNEAVKLNHYKKEYLKLQLDTYPVKDKPYGYELYRILRPANEISGTIEMVKEAQKVQDLIDITVGFSALKKAGITYFIADSIDIESGLASKNAPLIDFYTQLPNKAQLIKEITPKNAFSPGPAIKIYKLN